MVNEYDRLETKAKQRKLSQLNSRMFDVQQAPVVHQTGACLVLSGSFIKVDNFFSITLKGSRNVTKIIFRIRFRPGLFKKHFG